MVKSILKTLKILWPIGFLLLANILLFHQFYFRGLLPFPGDLLVSFFFPWFGGGFEGYNSWTTHKEYIASDALRALLPWKFLVIDQLKNLSLPIWNPYNFSGSPLLANLQSSVFFPGNLLYFILPNLQAWILQVLFLLTVFGLFTYLFLRSLKLSKPASVLGALAASNITYLVNWHELLVITQSVLFLPLILYLINKKKYLLTSVFLCFSLFGGHAQSVLYVYLLALAFMIYRKVPLLMIGITFGLGLLLSSIQLLPSLELYLHSAREHDLTAQLFQKGLFPWRNLITMFAPDFFGNPVTGNFWGWDYHNSLFYIGIVSLFFVIFSFFHKKHKDYFFFLTIVVLGVVFSTYPLAMIFERLRVPVFSTGIPARTIFLSQFSLCVLAAFGFDIFQDAKTKKHLIPPLIIGLLFYASIWIFVLKSPFTELLISRNNLIFPTGILILTMILVLLSRFFPRFLSLFLIALLFLALVEYARFFNKIEPFSPKEFAFPNHPVISFLQKNGGIERFNGIDTAYFESNFATYYHIFDPQGYDPLHIGRYGELIASSEKGEIPQNISRSDATIYLSENRFRNRLLDILGVKYLLVKNDLYKSEWEPDISRYPKEQYQLIWQKNKWKIYIRKSAAARFFLAKSYEVIPDKQKAIQKLYEKSFNPKEEIILSKNPKLENISGGSAKLISYRPNEVVIETTASNSGLLYLSDTDYPGWKVVINGNPEEILTANIALRAVPVPKGKNTVIFSYQPESLRKGAILTVFGVVLLVCLYYFLKKSEKIKDF